MPGAVGSIEVTPPPPPVNRVVGVLTGATGAVVPATTLVGSPLVGSVPGSPVLLTGGPPTSTVVTGAVGVVSTGTTGCVITP